MLVRLADRRVKGREAIEESVLKVNPDRDGADSEQSCLRYRRVCQTIADEGARV